MRKSRFTETQTVRVLQEVEGGRQVMDICCEYGSSDATCYNWKAKYGGMEVSDITRLKRWRKRIRDSSACSRLSVSSTKPGRIALKKSAKVGSETRVRRLRQAATRAQLQASMSDPEPEQSCLPLAATSQPRHQGNRLNGFSCTLPVQKANKWHSLSEIIPF